MTLQKKFAVVLSALIAIALTGSAAGKLLQSEQMVQMFASHGLAGWLTIIGAGELTSLLAFLIPKTRPLGSLLLSSYFGGAIMLHMCHGESFLVPAGFLVTIWIATWLWGDFRDLRGSHSS